MGSTIELLDHLIENYFGAVSNLESVLVFDRNGLLLIKKIRGGLSNPHIKAPDSDTNIEGAITSLVEKTLKRITTEYAIGTFGTGSFETEDNRLIFTEAGPQGILLSVFHFDVELNNVLPYCFLVAEKISIVLEGKYDDSYSLSIPNLEIGYELGINPGDIIRTPVKYNADKTPKKTEMRYKLIVLGSANVGKTSLINQFVTKKFYNDYRPTLGISITSQIYNIQGFEEAKINFMIWDLAGQKFFQRVRKHYYQNAQAAFLMYDVTSRETFDAIDFWYQDVRTELPKVPFIILGNKIDLNDQRVISTEEAKEKARNLKCSFLETSAKTGENVMDAFNLLGIGLFFKHK